MKKLIAILSLVTFQALIANCEVAFVFELIRSGAKGPRAEESDYNPALLRPNELTAVGIRQSYILGREMRKRYIEKEHLLPYKLDYYKVIAFSREENSCLATTDAFLMGLYPIKNETEDVIKVEDIIMDNYAWTTFKSKAKGK